MIHRITQTCAIALTTAISMISFAYGSDHIDGKVTAEHPLSDLSDFYVFPSQDNNSLALVLNTYPIASSSAHFSEKVSYAFVMRRLSVDGTAFTLGEELRIDCAFRDEHSDGNSVTCTGGNGLEVTTIEDTDSGAGPIRAYFGRRSDPFFFNKSWAETTSKEGKIGTPSDSDTLGSLNVLSLILEIDKSQIFNGSGLIALAVEGYTVDSAGGPKRYLDRIGRPEITNVTLTTRGDDVDIRDLVNWQPAFDASADAESAMVARLNEMIVYYDGLDGETDWPEAEAQSLIRILKDDFLTFDLDKPCSKTGFFEIEQALLSGQPHTGCGGRWIEDDIVETLYTLYISRGRQSYDDGVTKPFKPVSSSFPYLASPATGGWPWLKTLLGGWTRSGG